MSNWAEINKDNVVVRVTVGDNNDPAGDEGYQWLVDNLGGTWIKTSYSGSIRKNFAGIGFTYDKDLDAFIPPKPFDSWVLDQNSCQWMPPVSVPDYNNVYVWSEDSRAWDILLIDAKIPKNIRNDIIR